MQHSKKYIQIWYLSGALLVFLILIVGGITRLTQSGLSIVDWKPLTGIIPPMSEADWLKEFDNYRQYPEYQQLNRGMSLSDFKFIFFWEYLHRVLARLIGLVFLIPFIWFLIKKQLDRTQFKRAFTLFGLGFLQGFMGWFMVSSGLVDVPYVSAYRLSVHLILAFIIFGCCLWFALDMRPPYTYYEQHQKKIKPWLHSFSVILILQIFWGALVAGHKAGYIYNTFPKMHQYWIPPQAWNMEPLLINLFENVAAVQFMHRLLGTILIVITLMLLWKVYTKPSFNITTKQLTLALAVMVGIQYLSGVLTLLYHVPLWLGVFHQAWSMLLFGVLVGLYHYLKVDHNYKSA